MDYEIIRKELDGIYSLLTTSKDHALIYQGILEISSISYEHGKDFIKNALLSNSK